MKDRTYRILVVSLLAIIAAASVAVVFQIGRGTYRGSFVTIPR